MNTNEKIIGFDARKMHAGINKLWDPLRKATFLIKEDVKDVLSTDTLAWPSVFHTHQLIGMSEAELEKYEQCGPERPDVYIGSNNPSWNSLPDLKKWLDKNKMLLQKPYWIVALTCIEMPDLMQRSEYGPYFDETDPPSLNHNCTFLGFDVSDGSQTSGLSNCGYDFDDFKEKTKELWKSQINKYHLFDSLENALEFRKFSDERIKEHAPFFVYGLYLLEEVKIEHEKPKQQI
jgi:hypothetical protein